MPALPYVIVHRKFLVPWLAGFLRRRRGPARQTYFETLLDDSGITISKLIDPAIHVPWSAIKCIDLAGLRPFDLPMTIELGWFARWLVKRGARLRHVSIMSRDAGYFQHRKFVGGLHKTWRAADNVLVLCNIPASAAASLRPVLKDAAGAHSIDLDIILLDWPDDP
jgi:hypothetical protein